MLPLPYARAGRFVSSVVLLCSLLTAATAHADAASEARDRYDRAIKFYEDGAYDAALVELMRAYELRPSFRLMYNIGQTRLAMRDYAGAIEAYQRYLREGGGQVTNERVAAVRAQLNDLQQRVGTLVVETDIADSEVLVDDIVEATAPLASPLVVNAGLRRVTVRHPQYPPQHQRVAVAAGEQHRVSLPLQPRVSEPAAAAAPTSANSATETRLSAATDPVEPMAAPAVQPLRTDEPAPQQAEGTDRTLAYVGTGLTAALVVGAAVLGAMTLSKDGDLDERRNQPGVDVAAFDEDRKEMRTFANITDGLGIGAIVVGGITTWLWLRDDSEPAERDTSSKRTTRVRVGVAGMGARVAGNF